MATMDDGSIPEMPDLSDLDEDERTARTDDYHSELVHFLTNSRGMRNTARGSIKQSLYAGGGALAGSFLLGPVGGLVGGVAGSVVGYVKSDEYDGMVLSVLKLEDHRKKKRLVTEVWGVLGKAGATARELETSVAFRESLVRLAERDDVRNGIWRACLHSIKDEDGGR
mmetsp:Transcript_59881/g.177502  ORF Transcript_59881/g.177502 Transcript_59881/m.177502 type:complete len:168 (-) Transcript_59881:483-986(-)|eukprot:CAMPEP_0113541514 /NCGR_PEP_ID=MMETSP0015_2-20120614/9078_1 /TAXON_ID=2838 /ORGANISM="Odontella" /LENGTH=167 /DNA_ID=CAMNT_0000441437 /DNA_START=114 /DNA_END=617 /DNA_ORIENTATION=- /assembly_acc=CAM_ASM_000160